MPSRATLFSQKPGKIFSFLWFLREELFKPHKFFHWIWINIFAYLSDIGASSAWLLSRMTSKFSCPLRTASTRQSNG